MSKIALFTIAAGKDSVYFDSVRRYFPYNGEYFGQNQNVDYFLFADRKETIWKYTLFIKLLVLH
jgi:hypothetical protein